MSLTPDREPQSAHPAHYTLGMPPGVAVVDVIRAHMEVGGTWDTANALKYILRHTLKGNPKQDMGKAIRCLNMWMEQQGRQPAPTEDPSHTEADPAASEEFEEFEEGDWVRVTGPDTDPLLGKVGRVRANRGNLATVDFSGVQVGKFYRGYLEPAPKPER